MNIKDEDTVITVTLKNQPKLIAHVTVAIKTETYGWVTIKKFCIWKSEIMNSRLQEHINITTPTYPAFGKFHHLVFIEDEKAWYKLEARIYDAYHLKRSEESNVKLDGRIDPDEIPPL